MTGRGRRLLIGAAAALLAMPVGAREAADLELVMATDVSGSIDEAEASLQRKGIADAFRGKAIVSTIIFVILLYYSNLSVFLKN